eukprot:5046318-Amphidinium_carterae.1
MQAQLKAVQILRRPWRRDRHLKCEKLAAPSNCCVLEQHTRHAWSSNTTSLPCHKNVIEMLHTYSSLFRRKSGFPVTTSPCHRDVKTTVAKIIPVSQSCCNLGSSMFEGFSGHTALHRGLGDSQRAWETS